MQDKTYYGHKNWNHWNVCLWLYNEESLYRLLQCCKSSAKTNREATYRLMGMLPAKTPDGVRYSFSSVYAAVKEA